MQSYQLWCWQRWRGTCSAGLKGWWSPSCLLSEKSRGRLQLCSQLKLSLNKNWITCGQSFLREHGLGVWLCKMDCSGRLVQLPQNNFFFWSPWEFGTTVRCLKASAKFPECLHYRSIFLSCWATSDAFNDSASDRDAQTLHICLTALSHFTKTMKTLHQIQRRDEKICMLKRNRDDHQNCCSYKPRKWVFRCLIKFNEIYPSQY